MLFRFEHVGCRERIVRNQVVMAGLGRGNMGENFAEVWFNGG